MGIFITLLVLGIIVAVHEFGHFLLAKLFDVKVTNFSIGFGPPIISGTIGETKYQISPIPLGGYVKFFGDENGASVPDQAAVNDTGKQIHVDVPATDDENDLLSTDALPHLIEYRQRQRP